MEVLGAAGERSKRRVAVSPGMGYRPAPMTQKQKRLLNLNFKSRERGRYKRCSGWSWSRILLSQNTRWETLRASIGSTNRQTPSLFLLFLLGWGEKQRIIATTTCNLNCLLAVKRKVRVKNWTIAHQQSNIEEEDESHQASSCFLIRVIEYNDMHYRNRKMMLSLVTWSLGT
jgi:hypothetical protein